MISSRTDRKLYSRFYSAVWSNKSAEIKLRQQQMLRLFKIHLLTHWIIFQSMKHSIWVHRILSIVMHYFSICSDWLQTWELKLTQVTLRDSIRYIFFYLALQNLLISDNISWMNHLYIILMMSWTTSDFQDKEKAVLT